MTSNDHRVCRDRRWFLSSAARGIAGLAAAGFVTPPCSAIEDRASEPDDLIEGIHRSLIFNGRERGPTWFHPRACAVPSADGADVLMTLQTIGGSDYFGPVHWTVSRDGQAWTPPQPVPGLGREPLEGGYEMGVCDVVPEYHPPTRTVLAIGHNVYYRDGRLARPQCARWPVYVVRRTDGTWSERRRLEWDDPRGSAIYTCGCAQRVTLDDGDILVPLSFGPEGREHRSAGTVRCRFDGTDLVIREAGNELTNTAGRGLLEPSLARWRNRFYMTIRAEDERGYVTHSDDGLNWQPPQPWAWDDGEPLAMSTTQQRWLVHSGALFLVYTRKAARNASVVRWRAPLFVAQVDERMLRLVRASERVVLPLVGDGINAPRHVALMGNFHTLAASPRESWVTVGENRPNDGWRGDTLLARIRWSRPNQLAPGR